MALDHRRLSDPVGRLSKSLVECAVIEHTRAALRQHASTKGKKVDID